MLFKLIIISIISLAFSGGVSYSGMLKSGEVIRPDSSSGLLRSRSFMKFDARVRDRQVYEGDFITVEVFLEYKGRGGPRIQHPNWEDYQFEQVFSSEDNKVDREGDVFVYQFKTTFILMPLKTGKLTIPSFTAGNSQTLPIQITVKPRESED